MIAQILWNFEGRAGSHLVIFTNGADRIYSTGDLVLNFSLGALSRWGMK